MATDWESRSKINRETSQAKSQDHYPTNPWVTTGVNPNSASATPPVKPTANSTTQKDREAIWGSGIEDTTAEIEDSPDMEEEIPAAPERYPDHLSPTQGKEAEIQHDSGEGKWYTATIDWGDGDKLRTRTQKGLRDYLQDFFGEKPLIRDIASVLIPGAVAAFLFPVFGPVVAAGAAAVAVQNGLKLLKINVSDQTVNALFKPFENRPLDGSDVQSILADTLKYLLPKDEQVNKDVTEVVKEKIIPEIRDVALERLRSSLEASLKKQSGQMEKMASALSKLVECPPQNGASLS